MSGFYGAFATGVASQQGTLTLPDTWFRPPFWDLLVLQIVETRFLELAMSLLDFSPWIPLGTFSIFFFLRRFHETNIARNEESKKDVTSIKNLFTKYLVSTNTSAQRNFVPKCRSLFPLSTTWWVPLLVDQRVYEGTCSQVLRSTSVDS